MNPLRVPRRPGRSVVLFHAVRLAASACVVAPSLFAQTPTKREIRTEYEVVMAGVVPRRAK